MYHLGYTYYLIYLYICIHIYVFALVYINLPAYARDSMRQYSLCQLTVSQCLSVCRWMLVPNVSEYMHMYVGMCVCVYVNPLYHHILVCLCECLCPNVSGPSRGHTHM